MTTTPLTTRQIRILQGLYYGPAFISATERGDFELMDVVRRGYAVADYRTEGCAIWRIAVHGRDYLRDNGQTPSASADVAS